MSNRSKNDIARSLPELSDEDAIAIMEGRAPMAEPAETQAVAHEFAVDVLRASVEPEASAMPESDPGTEQAPGNVVLLINRQPWLRMAAAMVAGVALASIVGAPLRVADQGPTGAASTNVAYLEVMRSSGPADVPVLEISPSEPWLTLIAYPNFAEAEGVDVRVERALTSADTEGSWQTVLELSTGVGLRDSLVVNVPMASVEDGLYRLRMDSLRQGDIVDTSLMRFRVQLQSD